MKKILFVAVVAATLMVGTTSCNSKKDKCWKTTVTYTVDGETKTEVKYSWCPLGDNLAEEFANSLVNGLTGAKVDKRETVEMSEYKTKEDCLAHNEAPSNY